MIKYLSFIKNNSVLNKLPEKVLLDGLLQSKIKTVKAKDVLYIQGSTDSNVYYILKGAVRGHFDDHRKEISSMYYKQGDMVANVNTIFSNDESWLTVQALMPTVLIYFPKAYLIKMIDRHPEVKYTIFEMLVSAMREYENRLRLLLCHSAKERYQRFRERYSAYIKYFQQKDIASYLAITPETLSRIKKELESEYSARLSKPTDHCP